MQQNGHKAKTTKTQQNAIRMTDFFILNFFKFYF